jgi:hypothetical protein
MITKALFKTVDQANQIAHKEGFGEIEMAAHPANFITGDTCSKARNSVHRGVGDRALVNHYARALLKRDGGFGVHTHWHSSGLHGSFLPMI